jgi:hypothetical protein
MHLPTLTHGVEHRSICARFSYAYMEMMGRTGTARTARGERVEGRGLSSPPAGRLPRAAAPLPLLAAPTKHVPRRNPRTYSHSAHLLSVHRHSMCGAQSSERYSLPLITTSTLSVGNSGVPHARWWFLEAMCEPAKPHGHSTVYTTPQEITCTARARPE